MRQELKLRVPRIPHWRYVLFLGEKHPEYNEPMRALARYIEEEGLSVGLDRLENPDADMVMAQKIFETPPFKKLAEHFLLENCPPTVVVDAFRHKFNEEITSEAVSNFRKYFFDTEVLNTYDMARYYEKNGVRMPKAPPVPGKMRDAYTAFKHGEQIKLSPNEMMMHMFYQSFFRAQELQSLGWLGDDKALKFMKSAADMLKTVRDGEVTEEMPEEFVFEIEYPEETAVYHAEGYDPEDDPNDIDPGDENV